MWKSSLCDYSDVHILFKGTINVLGVEARMLNVVSHKQDKMVEIINKQYLKIMHRLQTV